MVNMLGQRFYDETGLGFTSNDYNSIKHYTQGSYLNAAKVAFKPNNWINAAMAGIGDGHNGGGPIWAVFDTDAVSRENWVPMPPNVDIADTLTDLAGKIVTKYQRVPMPPDNLEQTVARYNSFVDSGTDDDFGKPKPLHLAVSFRALKKIWCDFGPLHIRGNYGATGCGSNKAKRLYRSRRFRDIVPISYETRFRAQDSPDLRDRRFSVDRTLHA